MLYIALRPWHGFPGIPTYMDATLTERIDGKDPYNKPVRTGRWYNYDVYRGNPVPPSGEHELPDHLYCICSGERMFTPDLYYTGYFYRFIISDRLLTFLHKQQLLEGGYDYCRVTMLSRKLEPITQDPYYIMRVFRFHNHLINWEGSPGVPKKGSVSNQMYYPELTLTVPELELPQLFFLQSGPFMETFICTGGIYQQMTDLHFKGFTLVSLNDYVAEQQYRDEHPMVDTKTAKQRDKLWFSK